MATMRDVAAAANVSAATVSRVLNGIAVDPAKAARVQAAVKSAGYRRNPIGRALRTRRTRNWSFIAADIEDSFFTSVLRGLDDMALANDHTVMVSNTNDDPEREVTHVRLAVENQVSGVVLATETTNPVALAPLLATSTPVVLIETVSVDCGEMDTVLVDNRLGARAATIHLIEQGYERIACLAGPVGHHATNERLRGYGEALAAASRTTDQVVEHADYRPEGGHRAALSLLDGPHRPDALLIFNSQMAAGAIRAARSRVLSIPRDLGIVAFDDASWTSLVTPPLTVVRQPTLELGRAAGEVLLDRAKHLEEPAEAGGKNYIHRVLAPELVVRSSSLRNGSPGPNGLDGPVPHARESSR